MRANREKVVCENTGNGGNGGNGNGGNGKVILDDLMSISHIGTDLIDHVPDLSNDLSKTLPYNIFTIFYGKCL
jgi:hypothetical protein